MKKDYLFIGDVHSQADPLIDALNYAEESNLIPILLGDIWDSRNDIDQTLQVMQAIWEYKEPLGLIQSNHQWKLLRYLKGQIPMDEDIYQTVTKVMPYRKIVVKWLESLPFGIIAKASDGREYRLAHAMFPSRYEGKSKLLLGTETNRKVRDLCLYGSRGSNGGRDFWWLRPPTLPRNWIRVAGHYHTVYSDDKSIIIDGSCGDYGGLLVTYNTRTGLVKDFPV